MLMLTKPEYTILEDAFNKLATLATDGRKTVGIKVPGASCEMSSDLVKIIAETISTLGVDYNKQGLTKIPAGRKMLRAFEQYLKQQLYSLTMNVLPEYDQRVRKAQSDAFRARLRIYIYKLKARIELVTNLIKKVDKELNR